VGAIACSPDGNDPSARLRFQYETTNSDSSILFLEDLHKDVDGPVLLLWDGLPAHRSKQVTAFIKEQSWLTVERLPAYAPELNPVEFLWAAMKNKHTANACDDTIEQLYNRLEKAHQRYSSERQILKGFLKASKLYG